MLRKSLLACGVLASIVYVGVDVLAAIRFPQYHSFTARAISELMATGAPTERLVDPFYVLYDVLMLAFGVGVWMASPRRRVRLVGGLLIAYAVIGLPGPILFEMNVRGSGGAGVPTADIVHIVGTAVLVLFILAVVAVGAGLHGRRFRLYSYATLLVMVVFGVLTSLASRGVHTGEPTPWFGLLERINIGAFLLWVVVLAASLWPAPRTSDLAPRHRGSAGMSVRARA